jgi:primosomal replication protein N
VSEAVNCCVLTACIAELESMRYTPAGIPALNLILEHASSVEEAGQAQQVKAALKAVALGGTGRAACRAGDRQHLEVHRAPGITPQRQTGLSAHPGHRGIHP